MPPGIGYSYQPGSQDQRLQQTAGGGSPTTAPQQAIRTMSLRVPQTQSVPGLAPLRLLNAQGGGGNDLDFLLKALMAAFGQQVGPAPGRGSFGGGPPRVRPGIADPNEQRGPLVPMDREAILREKSNGRGGFGDTGRGPMGPLGPAQGMPFEPGVPFGPGAGGMSRDVGSLVGPQAGFPRDVSQQIGSAGGGLPFGPGQDGSVGPGVDFGAIRKGMDRVTPLF